LVPKGIDKYTGVQTISELLGVDNKDVIAFGDEFNDEQMIQHAGFGVAMKNAQPKIKAVADAITKYDNDEDGLAHFIETKLELI
jgi:hydroxymethylpyrimidine pyrophosphatase-like HAD family hydrolase